MINTKRTWNRCGDGEIVSLFHAVKEEAKRLYPATFEGCEPELYIDSSTRHLGMCLTEYTKSYTKEGAAMAANAGTIRYKRGVILLSKYILHDKDKVVDVLCHEFGHFVCPRENHNYLWKIRANRIGEKWGVTNERLDKSNTLSDGMKMVGVQKAEAKYVVACPVCHAEWKRVRICSLVKSPNMYRCTKCSSPLIRVK